jgi:hypothetical protein
MASPLLAFLEVCLTQCVHIAAVVKESQIVGATSHILIEPRECGHDRTTIRRLLFHNHVHHSL